MTWVADTTPAFGWGQGQGTTLFAGRENAEVADVFDLRYTDWITVNIECVTSGGDTSDSKLFLYLGQDTASWKYAHETVGTPAAGFVAVALAVKEWVIPVNTNFSFRIPVAAEFGQFAAYYTGGADPTTVAITVEIARQGTGKN